MIQLQLVFLCLMALNTVMSLPREIPGISLRIRPMLRDSLVKDAASSDEDDSSKTSKKFAEEIEFTNGGVEDEFSDTSMEMQHFGNNIHRDSIIAEENRDEPTQHIESSSEDEINEKQKSEDCGHEGLEFLKDFFKLPQHFYNYYAGK